MWANSFPMEGQNPMLLENHIYVKITVDSLFPSVPICHHSHFLLLQLFSHVYVLASQLGRQPWSVSLCFTALLRGCFSHKFKCCGKPCRAPLLAWFLLQHLPAYCLCASFWEFSQYFKLSRSCCIC